MGAGYLLLSAQPLAVRLLSEARYSAPLISLIRFLIGAAVVLALTNLGRRLDLRRPGLLSLRAALGGLAVVTYFASIELSGAGRATLLNYTYPLWANVLGIFFGYRPPRSYFAFLLLALVGVALIVGGDPSRAVSLGDALGLLSAILAGAGVLTIKELRKTHDSLTIVMALSVGGLATSGLLLAFGPSTAPIRPEWAHSDGGLLLAVGMTSVFGHLLFTRGYSKVSLALGTILSLVVPLLTATLSHLLLKELFSTREVLGGLILGLALASASLSSRTPGRTT